jgi:hypothetical protein
MEMLVMEEVDKEESLRAPLLPDESVKGEGRRLVGNLRGRLFSSLSQILSASLPTPC